MLYSFIGSCFLTFLTSFFFAAFVLYKNPKSKINIFWALMGFSVAVWALGLGLMSGAPTQGEAIFYLTFIHYLGALMIPVFFLHFVLVLLDLEHAKKWLLVIVYLLTLSFQIANFYGYLAYVEPVSIFKFYTRPGPAYGLFTTFFFLIVTYTIYLLFRYYKISTDIKRDQIGCLFISMVIGFGGGSTAFFPVFDMPVFPFGMYFMFLHIPIMTFAIIKHQLMGIDVFLKKGLLYTFIFALAGIPIFLICYFVNAYAENFLLEVISLTVVVIAIGLVLPKLKIRGEITIENILSGNKFNYRKALRSLRNAFISKLELEALLKTIVETLAGSLDLREAAIFIKKDNGDFYMASFRGANCSANKILVIAKNSPLISYLLKRVPIINSEQVYAFLRDNSLRNELEFLKSIDLKLLLPLRSSSGLNAILILGAMHSEFAFSGEDQEIFSNLSTEIGIAIENAMAFKQIQDLNVNLDNKVNERTKELRITLEKLKSAQAQIIRAGKLAGIGSLAAGIAHEINNALNGTLNCAFALDRDLNAVMRKERTFDQIADEIPSSLRVIRIGMDRARNIVNHLMRFSRKNSEGFKMDKIHGGIDSSLVLLQNELNLRNIRLERKFCDTNEVYCNLAELNQVFFNIIHNAIDAIGQDGIITIKTWTSDGQFYISIEDTGTGIDPKNLDQIFDPFFTTKPVGKGTGLGLSTSYNIIRDHGGEIEGKNNPAKGATFTINIPINKTLGKAV